MATESPKMLVYYIPVSTITLHVVYTSCNTTNMIMKEAENRTRAGLCSGQYFACIAGEISCVSFLLMVVTAAARRMGSNHVSLLRRRNKALTCEIRWIYRLDKI